MTRWTHEQFDTVTVLTFRRPPDDLIDFAALLELGDLLEAAATDATTSVVVLTGAPGHFIGHADLADLAAVGAGTATPAELGAWSRALDLLETIPQPTVAAIDGLASGGGHELTLACTVRLVSPRARLQQPEVPIGIVPGGGGSVRLPRLVGPGVAAEIVLTGREVGAAEAYDRGLANVVIRTDPFVDGVVAWAQQAARAPAAALAAAKTSIVRGSRLPFGAAQQLERELFGRLTAAAPVLGAAGEPVS